MVTWGPSRNTQGTKRGESGDGVKKRLEKTNGGGEEKEAREETGYEGIGHIFREGR